MDLFLTLLAISIVGVCGSTKTELPPISHTMFPEGFIFGAATASYQIEGGWNADGKGPNIWDNITHERPSFVDNNDNGDVAADSYHRYKEDVQLLENIGFQMYRFSLSWARILPNGRVNNVNQPGIDYYMNLIDELLAKGIQPMVTIYHWDLPQDLEDIGGWTNPEIVNIFEEFADLVFQTYGDKVKWWITINEAFMVTRGYGADMFAPAAYLDLHGIVEYQVARNLLLAHARAYRLYQKKYSHQNGKLSMAFAGYFCIPATDHLADIAAAERCYQHTYGWFAHPIFVGDYPSEMKKRIDLISKLEGRNASRLPPFTQDEIDEIRGTADFYGLNHYTTNLAADGVDQSSSDPNPSSASDTGFISSADPSWPDGAASWFKVVPQGIRLHVKKICEEYGNPEIIVVENGYSEDGSNFTHDPGRIYFLETYLGELRESIYTDGCNVRGHITYSFLDSFEWKGGYMDKFGLVSVDFNNPNRTRTMKNSAHWMRNYIEMHKIYYQ
uniref:Myrosinase 1 n=1 Tax=Lygus hesperus TaxID=30085 RepID=A0A0K8TCE1_LYGHE